MRATICAFALLLATAAWAGPTGATVEGPVLETIHAGTYTYFRVQAPDGPVWGAAPRFEVPKGQVVRFPGTMPMQGYHSKTLDRTFDTVYFVGQVELVGAAPEGAPADAPRAQPSHPLPAPAPDLDLEDIARAEGGKTVGELMDERKDLAGKTVRVRGKVVRATENVMGKNWLHLRDGSAGKDGADDLTVTTTDSAKVGDVVVIEGTLAVDRSFGHGYDYPVIVEDAKRLADAPAEMPGA